MRKISVVLIAFALSSVILLQPTGAQHKRHRNISISTGPGKVITDCSQLRIRIGDGETVRSEQTQLVPRSSVSSLQVRSSEHGGIHVQGWTRDEYSVKACLAVAADSDVDAQQVLNQLKLSIQNGEVTVRGPDAVDWIAYLIIQAPNGATLDLSSKNGPIGLSGISGSIQARNVNGPVSFDDVTGQVRAEVQNGPIDVAGSSGDFKLNVQNGPLTISLVGSQWMGGELEGHTQNGPLTLRLPDGYQSSVRVNTSKHSPVECAAGPCREALRTWDRPNVIEFGSGEPVIRLSTVNGPVTITSPREKH